MYFHRRKEEPMSSPTEADDCPLGPDCASEGRTFHTYSGDAKPSGLESRSIEAQRALETATTDALTRFLVPFAETFSLLHAVALDEIPTSEALPELDLVDSKVRESATKAVEKLIVAGGTAGVVSAALILGVRSPSFISTVAKAAQPKTSQGFIGYVTNRANYTRDAAPKIAAQSRFWFEQTRRNVASNKGPLLVAGFGVASVSLAIWWVDKVDNEATREAHRRQYAHDAETARRDGLINEFERERLDFQTERTEEATLVLSRLVDIGVGRLTALSDLVADHRNYDRYTRDDRLLVAELAGLAETTAAVISSSRHETTPVSPQTRGAVDAANDVIIRYSEQRRASSHTGPLVAWTAASLSTTSHVNQLLYLLEQPEYLRKLAKRCGNAHQGVQNGFHFEWAHELSFNIASIGGDSELRARLTERLGRPHDPADLVIQSAKGDTLLRVQAKVVESNSHRVGPNNGMADPKYAGMDLLIPTDDVPRTEAFIAKLLERPRENVYTDAYRDAKSRITDSISSGDISSDPITTGELTLITKDPAGHIQRLIGETRRQQATTAGFTVGGMATVMSLATDTTNYLIGEGHLDGFDWAQASIAAARTGVASAIAASAGKYLQSGAQVTVAGEGANTLQQSIAHGDHGPALAQAVVDIAAIAHGLATKRLSPEEAAKAAASTITESVAVWACTAVARRVAPDPEVAALVGGIVGQIGTQLLIKGLRVASLGRDLSSSWDGEYDALIAATAELEAVLNAEREELSALTERYRARFTEEVLPALDRVSANPDIDAPVAPKSASTRGSADALGDLATVAEYFGGSPGENLDAFDAFMADPTRTLMLVLDHTRSPFAAKDGVGNGTPYVSAEMSRRSC
jgi:hypothetical protein